MEQLQVYFVFSTVSVNTFLYFSAYRFTRYGAIYSRLSFPMWILDS